MTSSEVRKRFLEFFEKREHTIIPSASLVPENDPTVLFNTAGMQPLTPYLLGEKHPAGKRLVNFQKCVRTNDINEVGDNTHLTFFEMMGNWSLGDYFKKEAIGWSYELLTDKKIGFGLDSRRLYVTCFEGDKNAARDDESADIWREIFKENGVTGERIYFMPAEKNWWQPGPNGPCGPDTEMFYDLTGTLTDGMMREQFLKAEKDQKIVEIWNDVFMEYVKKDDKVVGALSKKNVDTGAGFERICTVLQGQTNVFDTDLFKPVMDEIKRLSGNWNLQSARIIADHVRASIFLIADGVTPSNTDRGYVLRKLLRRAIRKKKEINLDIPSLFKLVPYITKMYKDTDYKLTESEDRIIKVFKEEGGKFVNNLDSADAEIVGLIKIALNEKRLISGKEAFILYSSYGFPIEETIKIAKSKDVEVDIKEYEKEFKKHRELSRVGAEKKFKGGLGDTSEISVKYHTATHLLHQALRQVLGEHVSQKGSNITSERLRFDFTHTTKMTDEEKQKVEDIVNANIKAGLPVHRRLLPKEGALKTGALHFFGDKYGDVVSVYYIGDSMDTAVSKEFCGGPHVENTGEIGTFKIQKEEAVSAGVRRIKAVLS